MASTFDNNLRLREMGTGDESGTWGARTNENLELIGEAFGFGTEAVSGTTHTTTIANGATDPGRAMYLKYTGSLSSACTITLAPDTISKLWFIENATSGSQNIIIKQGSGATITIPASSTKLVYSDGAGSGAAIVDALDKIDLIQGYTFNKLGKKTAGIIAQELEKVLPEAVREKKLALHDGKEYKTVEYDAIHGLLINCIKELKQEIEELKNAFTK